MACRYCKSEAKCACGSPETEGRFKIAALSLPQLHSFFVAERWLHDHKLAGQLNVPFWDDIPDSAMLCGITTDRWNDCLLLRFCHPSFDQVPDGMIAPMVLTSHVRFRAKALEEWDEEKWRAGLKHNETAVDGFAEVKVCGPST